MSRTFPSLLLVETTALAGCTTQAAYVRPTVEAPTAWFNAPASAVSAAGATSPERWWTVLNDPAINDNAVAGTCSSA
jgi:outer membrane protein TolC